MAFLACRVVKQDTHKMEWNFVINLVIDNLNSCVGMQAQIQELEAINVSQMQELKELKAKFQVCCTNVRLFHWPFGHWVIILYLSSYNYQRFLKKNQPFFFF